jgi:pimeloyl-ACP methyl ester carboxylesterase
VDLVRSPDGAALVLERTGDGPTLLLVHGAFVDARVSPAVVQALARHFTVAVLHRRGRQGSDPYRADHAIEREFEDVAAAIDLLDRPAVVVGHSYGAWCALYGVQLSRSGTDHLVLYEPAPLGVPPLPVLDAIRDALARDATDEAIAVLLRAVNGMDAAALDAARGSPFWRLLRANAGAFVPELEGLRTFRFDPERFAAFDTPTLLLAGTESPPPLRRIVELVAAALGDARVQEIVGQGHGAMSTAPEVFAEMVTAFATG